MSPAVLNMARSLGIIPGLCVGKRGRTVVDPLYPGPADERCYLQVTFPTDLVQLVRFWMPTYSHVTYR